MKPIHEHNCDCCTYLGAFKEHDLYYCEQGGLMPTIIARFGNDGPDYKSGIAFADIDEHIKEGVMRAESLIGKIYLRHDYPGVAFGGGRKECPAHT